MIEMIDQHSGLKIIYDTNLGHHRLDSYPTKEVVEGYYRNDHFYASHSPPDWFEKEWTEYQAGWWNSYFAYLVRLGLTSFQNTILDYGCGCGWLIDFIRNKHSCLWNHVKGVEPSWLAVEYGQSKLDPLPIRTTLADLIIKEFDLVYLNLVLEHIINPVEVLKELVETLLAEQGRLVIVVPNDLNPLQTKLNYTGFISPVHVNYFTPTTLRGVMEAAGLKVVHESATFPMELFPLVGINYIGNDALGRRCHHLRLRWEKLLGPRIFGVYKRLYDRWGIGRELIFVGEK